MREDERGEGEVKDSESEREREGYRDSNGKRGAKARGTGGREGEMIARNSSPGRCGVEGIIQTLPSLSCLPHLSKRVCESRLSVCGRERERESGRERERERERGGRERERGGEREGEEGKRVL